MTATYLSAGLCAAGLSALNYATAIRPLEASLEQLHTEQRQLDLERTVKSESASHRDEARREMELRERDLAQEVQNLNPFGHPDIDEDLRLLNERALSVGLTIVRARREEEKAVCFFRLIPIRVSA